MKVFQGKSLWLTIGLLLAGGLLLTACGDDEGLGEDDDDNGDGREPGGDTSAYSGLLAWSHGDGGEGSGVRVWQLEDSEFQAAVTQGDNGEHLAPVLSRDGRALSYTSEQEPLGAHRLSQVQYLSLSDGTLIGVPWVHSSGQVRASRGSDMDQFANVVGFAERIYDEASGDLLAYGAGLWTVGHEEAESLVEANAPVHCVRLDPNANFMIFNAGEGLYRVATTGGDPQPLNINHPNLASIQTEPTRGGRCAFELADNGNRLAFVGELSDSGERAAFFHELDSAQTTQVAATVDLTLVDWQMAANGSQGVLLFKEEETEGDLRYSLRTVNLINPGATTEIDAFELAEEAPIEPSVAVSGNGMVIARSGHDEDGIHVMVMDSSGNEPRRIQGNAETMGDGMLGLTF